MTVKLKDMIVEIEPYTLVFHLPKNAEAEITYTLTDANDQVELSGTVIKKKGLIMARCSIDPSFELIGSTIKYGVHPYYRVRVIKDYGRVI